MAIRASFMAYLSGLHYYADGVEEQAQCCDKRRPIGRLAFGCGPGASASRLACPIPQLPLLGIHPQADQLPQPRWALGYARWTAKEIDQVQDTSDHDRQPQ